MVITTTGSLLDALRQGGLLKPEVLADLVRQFQGRFGEPRPLAKHLLTHGLLTVFQVNQLLQGEGADLAVGPYRLLDRLGEGGVSQVYKANHFERGYAVVLKVIRPELLSHPEAFRQFQLEMKILSELEHPNIVRFYDAGESGDRHYFAMEFVEGIDLGKVVRLGGGLPVAQACDYIRQAAMGLQHAYEHNLVHRDIKPVNLFVTMPKATAPAPAAPAPTLGSLGKPAAPATPAPPTPKAGRAIASDLITILDWGLACPGKTRKQLEECKARRQAGGVIGTADYMSPEQARNADAVDIRSDVYSLGCSFYYLLAGQPPFAGGSVMQKILQHQQAEPPPIQSHRPDIPEGLGAVLQRALAKKPEDRFQTPAALAIALRPYYKAGAVPSLAQVRAGTPEQRRPAEPTLHNASALADTGPLSTKKPSPPMV
jgi:serine/threonine-protein kinase